MAGTGRCASGSASCAGSPGSARIITRLRHEEELVPARIPALYHPTIAVGDLDAARDWFRRVFARRPLRWEETLDLDLLEPDYPVNYSFFAFVADIHWVFLCPALHARGAFSGQTRYKDVPDGMIG